MKSHLCVLLLVGRVLYGAALAQAGGIVVLAGEEKEYYQACLEGLRGALEEPERSIALPEEGDADGSLRVERELRATEPSVVATLGTRATLWAMERAGMGGSCWPICFAMVPSRASLGLNEDRGAVPTNLTGVLLQIPMERQVDAIRRLLPEARRLGVVHSDANRDEVPRLRDVCESRGLGCETYRVGEPREIATAFESLSKHVDVLLALPDPVVYSGPSARYVLLFSLQRRLPLVAFSAAYVKGGALMGLYADPGDVGRQWGAMVRRIGNGADAGSIPLEFPQKIRLGWNRKVADRLGIPQPDSKDLGSDVGLEMF